MQFYLLMSGDVILLLLLKMQLNCTTVEKYSGLSLSQAEVSNSLSSFKSCVLKRSTSVLVKVLEKEDMCKEQNWREKEKGTMERRGIDQMLRKYISVG